MKRFAALFLIFLSLVLGLHAQEQTGPWTFWQFTVPKELAGQPLINGFRILSIQEMRRESCDIHCQTGIFKINEAGSADSVMPVEGYLIRLSGEEYATFKNGTPIEGLTREQDLMAAAYQAVVAHQATAARDWAGTLQVAP